MTLQMRDQINIEQGIEQGTIQMITNALRATHSVKRTAEILDLSEPKVRRIAEEKELQVDD